MEGRLKGLPEAEVMAMANSSAGLRPRDWMRFRIEGDSMLSLPVEGGASALKNGHPESWRTAREARREAGKIDATMATVYGRTPYFHLLKDTLSLSVRLEEGMSAHILCNDIFMAIKSLLQLDDDFLIRGLGEKIARGDGRLRNVAAPFSELKPDLTIAHSLFKYGPEAIFALLPAF